jgi:MOSC domain-containing protein YiiM
VNGDEPLLARVGTIAQLNVSPGGVPKLPVPRAEVGPLGIVGDGHNNKVDHGGPERALCLYSLERITSLAAEGHPIAAGCVGENVTVRGLDWTLVVPGARLLLGRDVLVEITRYTPPCKTNQRWFTDGNFSRMNQKVHPGWSRTYARVLIAGTIKPGDTVELL